MVSLTVLQSVFVNLNGSETIFAISACWIVYPGSEKPKVGWVSRRPPLSLCLLLELPLPRQKCWNEHPSFKFLSLNP